MRSALGLVALLLAGCAATPPIESFIVDLKPASLAPADKASAERAVIASLKDPDSARFGPAFGAVDKNGVKYACGTVNAKNGMGGYTGAQMYAVKWAGPAAEVVSIGDDYIGGHSCRRMLAGPAPA